MISGSKQDALNLARHCFVSLEISYLPFSGVTLANLSPHHPESYTTHALHE